MAQPAHPPSSIMAQGGSVVAAPQLVGCSVAGSVYQNISVSMPSHGAGETIIYCYFCSSTKTRPIITDMLIS
jgi:hypothetical protein